jgi:hypothetical protein
MAEGGGTVAYLAKQNPNGVSVHYVIEYRGRIVQMLSEARMHSSIRTTSIRTTDDADGFYGVTAARAVMGKWADTRTSLGPNHASIGVEIEGFAGEGPNLNQRAAMAALFADIRTRYPTIRSLGHRDFASYKACPGKYLPWGAVGGHGTTPATPETDTEMPGLATTPRSPLVAGVARIPAGTGIINVETRDRSSFQSDGVRQAVGIIVRDYESVPGYLIDYGSATCWVAAASVEFTPNSTVESATYAVSVDGKHVGNVTLP